MIHFFFLKHARPKSLLNGREPFPNLIRHSLCYLHRTPWSLPFSSPVRQLARGPSIFTLSLANASCAFRNPRPASFSSFFRPQGSKRPYHSYSNEKRRFQQALPWYYNKRNIYLIGGVGAAGSLYYVSHLEEAPITGRKRFIDLSPKQEARIGQNAYRSILHEFGPALLPSTHPTVRMVAKVAEKLIQAAKMENLDWKVHVISSPEKNAFVLPGGLIFVFTGILPVCQDEDGLAVVLGHEIAHQFARHSAEKMSFTKVLFLLQIALSIVFDTSMYMSQFFTQMLLSLPFSRKMENEADYIGLLLTAGACFDPRAAIGVWERMAKATRLNPPEFLSTHPNPSTRIEQLRSIMPVALQKRSDAGCENVRGFFDEFSSKFL